VDIVKELKSFGANEGEVILLDSERHELINYLDLRVSHNSNSSIFPDAVLEVNGSPILYIVHNSSFTGGGITQEKILALLRILACRNDAQFLAVVDHGQITVYPISLSNKLPQSEIIKSSQEGAKFFIRDLAAGYEPVRLQWVKETVDELLLKLLTGVTKNLLETEALNGRHEDVLSLVGRALFARFLLDKGIINSQTFPELYALVKPEECFSTPDIAAMTCSWLDKVFNGYLLPISTNNYVAFFNVIERKSKDIFKELSNVLYRSPGDQLYLNWSDLNFAHVPIGILSQVYEQYAHRFFGEEARKESIHYTPRHLADFMLKHAFPAIKTTSPHFAKVLDPAVGAGVFLVLCFRRLVAERWKSSGKRPETQEIRTILYKQIRGFDINQSALELTALSLYFTALELDPEPFPPDKLTFEPLIGKVLFNVRGKDEHFPIYPVLGSLGQAVGVEHEEQYDLVIGNPPWTSWKGDTQGEAINEVATSLVRKIAAKRNRDECLTDFSMNYKNPDNVPDIPFIWRAMEFAKPAGVISFVVHGRLLFKRTDGGVKARIGLFRALRVTGILNGSGLDKKYWNNINQPFCILFAKNEVPDKRECFHFVSPELDSNLNAKGRFRVDHKDLYPVSFNDLYENPDLFKLLYLGTPFDFEIMQRLDSLSKQKKEFIRLGDYWTAKNGLSSSQGYRIADSLKQEDANFISKMRAKIFHAEDKKGYKIDSGNLKPFIRKTLHSPRREDAFRPPLVLISEAPGSQKHGIRACIALEKIPIAYTQSFFGYSSFGHKHPEDIARYLFVLANSDLFIYYILMKSSKFYDRRTLQEEDIADFPIVGFELLQKTDISKIREISDVAFKDNALPSEKLNSFVNDLYEVSLADQQVIQDTLNTRMPFASSRELGQRPPTQNEIAIFCNKVEGILNSFLSFKKTSVVVSLSTQKGRSWEFIEIKDSKSKNIVSDSKFLDKFFHEIADHEGASRVLIKNVKGALRIGMLSQYRYWTQTRARQCALDIVRNHMKMVEE
jgi:hypothetical protein